MTEPEREHGESSGRAVHWVFWGFAAVGAYYLVTEHRAHLIDYLPFVLLMACPLMHLFHGHGGHGRHQPSKLAGPDESQKMQGMHGAGKK